MRALFLSISIVATALASWASPAQAQNAKAHKGAAERAIVKERWCEALFLYAKLDEVEPNPEWALQAADAAQFADDRPRAIALFKSALSRAPKHPRARAMEQSIAALEKLVGKSGNGSACSTPTPECGNGVLEGSETCDDGNRQSGDACPGTCSGTAMAPKPPVVVPPVVVPPLVKPPVIVPPVVVPPVVTPPVKVTPPVVTPPVVTPPVVTPPVAEVAGPAKLCTLIKPVKIFIKGEWKTYEFGSTLTIKSAGPQWTMVETPQGDGGKVATSTMDGACAHPDVAPTPEVAPTTTTPEPEVTEPEVTEPEVTEPEVTEPEVKEPEPEVKTIEPLKDEREPAAEAPEIEESEGGGLGGWMMLAAGGVLALGGGSAAVWGALPYFDYAGLCNAGFGATNCPALESLAADYRQESDVDDRAQLADDATELRGRVKNAAQAWDEGGNGGVIPQGRFVLAGGAGVAVVGVGLAVGGLIWALSSGGEPEEDEEEAE